MPKKFEDILDQCLDRLAGGEEIEAVLREYPDQADGLRPLLETASQVRAAAAPVEARPEFRSRARQQLLSQVRMQQAGGRQKRKWFAFLEWQRRWAFAAAAVIVVVLIGGGATVSASSNAMPDDLLYPVKIAVERARVTFAGSDMAKAKLEAEFAERRLKEITAMAGEDKWSRVQSTAQRLSGHLEAVREVTAGKRQGETISQEDSARLANTLADYAADLPQVLKGAIEQSPAEAGAAIAAAMDESEENLFDAVADLNVAARANAAGDSATPVSSPSTVSGSVRAIRGNKWIVGSEVVTVGTATANAAPGIGATVELKVAVQPDGSLAAHSISVAAPAVRTPDTGVVEQPEAEPEPTGEVVETPAVQPVPEMRVKPRPAATPTTEPAASTAVTPSVTLVTTPAATPASTQAVSQEPETREFSGTISRMTGNTWVIGDQAVTITSETRIEGSPMTGLKATVSIEVQPDGSLVARSVMIEAGETVEPEPAASDETPQLTAAPTPVSGSTGNTASGDSGGPTDAAVSGDSAGRP